MEAEVVGLEEAQEVETAQRIQTYLVACGLPLIQAQAWLPEIIAAGGGHTRVPPEALGSYLCAAQQHLTHWLSSTLDLLPGDCRLLVAQATLPEWYGQQAQRSDFIAASVKHTCVPVLPSVAPLDMPIQPIRLRSLWLALRFLCRPCKPFGHRLLGWLHRL